MMTRIYGYGKIGRKKYVLIPLGGKSVLAAGETFSSQILSLIYQLKKEYQNKLSHKLLEKVYTSLEKLLSDGDFVVQQDAKQSYLILQKSFNDKFLELAKTFDKLLDFAPVELGYINGGLLLVPCANIAESYQIKLLDMEKYANGELWENLQKITKNTHYPENLRFAVKDAIELVEKLNNAPDKTQNFRQKANIMINITLYHYWHLLVVR